VNKIAIAALVVGSFLYPNASNAAAVEFTDASVFHDAQLSLGFVFTTNQEVSVTALGYFDEDQDGFLTNHEVGIFDVNGALLISAILNAGSGHPLEGHYRYKAVTPITLGANSSFVLVGTTFGLLDGWAFGNSNSITGLVVDPRISVASDAARFIYENDNVLRVPTEHFGGFTIYGGPNFLLGASDGGEVPEPATLTLTLAGLAGVVFVSKRTARL
jgi:hypothetical protein